MGDRQALSLRNCTICVDVQAFVGPDFLSGERVTKTFARIS